ncbi:ORC1-type DNA replication protein [Candidatus Anstonella stagnisolia]|nr:ORC1-type DNA replication protein [Candidatus Anstonella stagnisolia]
MRLFSHSPESRIFKFEAALQPDYIPTEMEFRDAQLSSLAHALRPASENRQPENVLVYGPPGSGKTSSAKYVLKELCEYSSKPLSIYVNCWEVPTRFGIFSSILFALGEMMPRRGIAADEALERIVSVAKNTGIIPIIVLDEIDRLLASQYEEERVLYDLARASEVHGIKLGILGITNDKNFVSKLDSRVRSSLAQCVVEFPNYGISELKGILLSRATAAFFPDAVGPEVLPLCAAVGAKNGGDARLALNVLWRAGREAERQGAERVDISHVQKVKGESVSSVGFLARKELQLDEIDAQIIESLKKKPLLSGELYSLLSKTSERTIRNHLENLEKMGLLSTQEISSKDGRSRKISLAKK